MEKVIHLDGDFHTTYEVPASWRVFFNVVSPRGLIDGDIDFMGVNVNHGSFWIMFFNEIFKTDDRDEVGVETQLLLTRCWVSSGFRGRPLHKAALMGGFALRKNNYGLPQQTRYEIDDCWNWDMNNEKLMRVKQLKIENSGSWKECLMRVNDGAVDDEVEEEKKVKSAYEDEAPVPPKQIHSSTVTKASARGTQDHGSAITKNCPPGSDSEKT